MNDSAPSGDKEPTSGAGQPDAADTGRTEAEQEPGSTASQREESPRDTRQNPLRGSRTSGVWIAVALSGLVLVLLIVFIAQNTDSVHIRFLGWEGDTPLAVALLAAAVSGLFLAVVAGTLRILQLRRRVKRETT